MIVQIATLGPLGRLKAPKRQPIDDLAPPRPQA